MISMPLMRWALAGLGLCVLALSACRGTSTPLQPPADVTRAILVALGDEGRPAAAPLPGMFHPVQISDDGVTDWVADFSDDQAWCGSGGCRQMIFVSQIGAGHRAAFDQQTRAWSVTQRDGRANLDVEVYGAWCGEAGVVECRLRFVWDPALRRFVEAPNAAGQTQLHGPLYQVVDRADAPALVVEGVSSFEVTSVPDLDGDGVRDLVVLGRVGGWGARQTRVLASSTGFEVAVTTPGDEHSIDIATRPSRLWAAPKGDASAPMVAYAWNRASRRLEPQAPPEPGDGVGPSPR